MDEQKMALSAASSRVLRDSIVDGVLMSLYVSSAAPKERVQKMLKEVRN